MAGNDSGTITDGYFATVSGGRTNTASNKYATVPGGLDNTAGGEISFAAGRRAKALHNGSFVWGDYTDADIASTGNNQFIVRASGGTAIYSNSAATTGVQLNSGAGSWTSVNSPNTWTSWASSLAARRSRCTRRRTFSCCQATTRTGVSWRWRRWRARRPS